MGFKRIGHKTHAIYTCFMKDIHKTPATHTLGEWRGPDLEPFCLKTPRPPRPELRKASASGAQLPTAKAGPGGTLCTSHAPAASPRPLARTPRTKRKRRRNEADLPVQGCLPGFPLTSDNNAVPVSLHCAGKLSSRILVHWLEHACDCNAG